MYTNFHFVQNIHTALSGREALFSEKDPVTIKEHCKLVVGIGIWDEYPLCLIVHVTPSAL